MQQLERWLVPILVAIALIAWLLSSLAPDVVVIVARTVGLVLIALLVIGFVVRTIVKFRRGKAQAQAITAGILPDAGDQANDRSSTDQ